MKEIWKDIKNYEGRYQISNFGNVRSVTRTVLKRGKYATIKGRVLSLNYKSNGYVYIELSKNSKKKTFRVHRLVAEAFLENKDSKKQVNHKDLNKNNNIVDNLEWSTQSENMNHAYKNGACRNEEKHHKARLKKQDIIKIRILLNQGLKQRDIAEKFNVSQYTIWAIHNKKTWKYV